MHDASDGFCALSIPSRMEKAKRLQIMIPVRPLRRVLRPCLAALLLALACLPGCSRPDPEQQLRARLQAMQRAIEDRRPSDFMQGIAEDFAGNQGTDRAALHRLLRLQVLGRGNVGTRTGPLQVRMQGATATVRFTVLLSGGTGRFMPDSAQAYEITSGWREQGGQWRVYYAQWTPKL